MKKMNRFLSLLILALTVSASSIAIAQQTTTADGVFTADQAKAGADAYNAACKSCHDMKFYRDIWDYWEQKPLEGFWFRIVAEMPSQNPGSLLDEEYTNIVAYILSDLGYPAGENVLDPNQGMRDITISKRP